jgi:hypothetical protein
MTKQEKQMRKQGFLFCPHGFCYSLWTDCKNMKFFPGSELCKYGDIGRFCILQSKDSVDLAQELHDGVRGK